MIRDGVIFLDARIFSFRKMQLDSEHSNAVMLALLATVLAYQLTAIFYNIKFGRKERGLATASDIHKLMLTEYGSPLMIFAAMTRCDILDILRFRGDLPLDVKIARRDTKVTRRAAFGLIALLSIAPLSNIISIFIVMQHDERVTINQANVSGFALGVDTRVPDVNFLRNKFWTGIRSYCTRVPIEVIGPGTPLLKFSRCSYLLLPSGERFTSEKIRLTVQTTNLGEIKVSATSFPSGIQVSFAIHVDVSSEGKLFRIRPVLPVESAAELIHNGQKRLSDSCVSAKEQNSPHDESLLKVEYSNGLRSASKDFSCNLSDINDFANLVFTMSQAGIIEHDIGFRVTDVSKISSSASSAPEYLDAGQMALLSRRDQNVNVLPMLIVTLLAVLLRIGSERVYNNDLDEAMEAVIRHSLKVHPEESLLKSSRTVIYNSKRQDGGMGHYGLPRSQLHVVKEFGKGVEVGLMYASSTTSNVGD